jgi:exonuclease III
MTLQPNSNHSFISTTQPHPQTLNQYPPISITPTLPLLPTTIQSNPNTLSHTLNNSNYKNLITISTLNVRGLNEKEKLIALIEGITNERAILCCSETKSTQIKPLPKIIKEKTIISSKPNTSASSGACIITTKAITNHIFQTFAPNEFWCAIHLKFKPKTDIILISAYLPHDPILRKKAVKSLRDFIREKRNNHIILAGDFNSYPISSPSINAPSSPSKRQIYKYLNNFIDIAKTVNKEHLYTHFTSTSASRIDQI